MLRPRAVVRRDRRTARRCSGRRCRPTVRATTRMRSGCFSMLVPCSACAASAADVRLENERQPGADADAVQPASEKVATRAIAADVVVMVTCSLSRSGLEPIRLSHLILGRAEHQIQQFAQRVFELSPGCTTSSRACRAETSTSAARSFAASGTLQEPRGEMIDDLVGGVGVGGCDHRGQLEVARPCAESAWSARTPSGSRGSRRSACCSPRRGRPSCSTRHHASPRRLPWSPR